MNDQSLWHVWLSSFSFPLVAVADELGIFEYLETPRSLSEIETRFELPKKSAVTLVSVLTPLQLLDTVEGKFVLSELARILLLPKSNRYWGGMFLGWRKYSLYAEIYNAIKGAPIKKVGNGEVSGNYTVQWSQNSFPQNTFRDFLAAMESHSAYPAEVLAQMGTFDPFETMLDVGGGSGCFSIEAAKKNPEIRCTIQEIPSAKAITEDWLDKQPDSIRERIRVMTHDMFQSQWPVKAHAVFLSNILHDWNMTQNLTILRNAFEAVHPGGKIFLHEMVLDDDFKGPLASGLFSLVMLMRTEGRQYSRKELSECLQRAGFEKPEFKPAAHFFTLISAERRRD